MTLWWRVFWSEHQARKRARRASLRRRLDRAYTQSMIDRGKELFDAEDH